MIENNYFIVEDKTLLDALKQLNSLSSAPLVLFVVNSDGRMVGTMTDGDIRRALIAGINISDTLDKVMHRTFNYLREGVNDDVSHIREQKALKMQLVPILDSEDRIVDIIDLEKYRTKLPIDVVLMAGGKGERLRPLTENTPKPLLKMQGKPIIDYIVEHVISFGIKNISVTVNYLKEQIEEHFVESKQGVFVKCFSEPKFLGTIGGLAYVDNLVNETVLLMNSDAITDLDLEDFFLHFQEYNADMSIAAVPYTISVPYGILELQGRNVKGVHEKPTYNYYANTGIYLIKRRLLDLIPKGEFFNATDFMELLMKNGYKVIRFPLNGTWIDIGNQQEYQKAKEIVKHIKF
ncbi:CBS domain-containing protein [Prevotella brunnea]|uniref:CBS domain-containing protein n=1 Tax=Prevotella brunnea TaxID=2508867 RepID=A0A5C8GJZ1_9BACT|nr:sugar phosphate nucleotidyltransferase [Prevotella brunnea]MDR0185532.1 CBS domain-containing protein [Prevotella brunnea]TXJ62036.1 CBS domain-containing protein [Prevotella brunnea]